MVRFVKRRCCILRDELFAYMVSVYHSICFQREYKKLANRISNIYTGFFLLTSAASIAAWSFWAEHEAVWAVITVTSQILQILKPLLPFEKQRQALIYIMQNEQEMFGELEDYWYKVGRHDPPKASDEEIQDKIHECKERFQKVSNRFAADIDFPDWKWLHNKAKVKTTQYFWYYFNVNTEEEDCYAAK